MNRLRSLNSPHSVWRVQRRPWAFGTQQTLIADSGNHVVLAVDHTAIPVAQQGGRIVSYDGNSDVRAGFGVAGPGPGELSFPTSFVGVRGAPFAAALSAICEEGIPAGTEGHRVQGPLHAAVSTAPHLWFYGWGGGTVPRNGSALCELFFPLDVKSE